MVYFQMIFWFLFFSFDLFSIQLKSTLWKEYYKSTSTFEKYLFLLVDAVDYRQEGCEKLSFMWEVLYKATKNIL